MKSRAVYSIAELRSLVIPLASKYGFLRVRLFGSYARGEAVPCSDIDVLLDGGASFKPLSIFAFSEDLRLASGKDVDVYEVSELDPGEFRDAVLRDAVELWTA